MVEHKVKDSIQTTWVELIFGAGATNNNDDNVVDADFEVQDDK